MVKWRSGWRHVGRVLLMLPVVGIVVATAPVAAQSAPDRPVTFNKDIAPILQRSCQQCHHPDSVAPMSLLTFEQARPYARAMKLRTALARVQYGRDAMPPWFIEKNIGVQTFKDDISLSDDEIATIAKWADSGAAEGDPRDLPPPRTFRQRDRMDARRAGPDRVVANGARQRGSGRTRGAISGHPSRLASRKTGTSRRLSTKKCRKEM